MLTSDTNRRIDACRDILVGKLSLSKQRHLVAELDAEAAQMVAVKSLLPRFDARIQRDLDRLWGNCQ